ncbi:MAG: DUF3568 family protein [Syntrophales bacterium]
MKLKTLLFIHFLCMGLVVACAAKQESTPVTALAPSLSEPIYSNGELTSMYPVTFDRVWNAAIVTLDDLDMAIVSVQKIAGGVINALTSDRKPVQIVIQSVGPGNTQIGIRIGAEGDERTSRMINDQIASRLGIR